MADLIKSNNSDLISLFHGKGGDIAIPKPYERDIYLFDTHVAGTSHIEGIKELEPYLNIGDKLDFFREVDNQYDENAIVIKNADGVKIGYVPMQENIIFSRLLDAGKNLFGRITSKEMCGNWLKIKIQIFLHE